MPSAYIVLGHAYEILGRELPVVPEGCMLVLSEECGQLGTIPEHVLNVIQEPEYARWFEDPRTYKKELETLLRKNLHIYGPGESYPFMSISLFDVTDDNKVATTGVIPLPAPATIQLSPEKAGLDRYHIDGAHAWKAYADSVFPRVAKFTKLSSLKYLYEREKMEFLQHRLFKEAPGIHYNFLCRYVQNSLNGKNIDKLLSKFPKQELNNLNQPMGIYKMLQTMPHPVADEESRRAYHSLQKTVNRIMLTRNDARNRTEKRREAYLEPWNHLVRTIIGIKTTFVPPKQLVQQAAAVPDRYLNHTDKHYNTVLSIAAERGGIDCLPVIENFLSRGANPNIADSRGLTPLMYSGFAGHAIVQLVLLNGGADAKARTNMGSNALHFVMNNLESEDPTLVNQLVSAGADVNAIDANGNTPLHHFLIKIYGRSGKVEGQGIVRIGQLLSVGANVSIRNNDGYTPFMLAIKENLSFVILSLLREAEVRQGQADVDPAAMSLAIGAKPPADDAAVWLVKHAGYRPRDWNELLNRARRARPMMTGLARVAAAGLAREQSRRETMRTRTRTIPAAKSKETRKRVKR